MVTDYHGFLLYVPNYRIIEFFFFTRILFMSRIIEFFFFTRNVTDYHGYIFLVPNYRISELSNFFSHGDPRRITDIYFLSRIIELSNFSFSHGVPRRITDVFLYPELSNYRISFHTEFHGESRIYFFCHEFANSIIRDKEKHPWYSVTFRVKRKNRDSPWKSVWWE